MRWRQPGILAFFLIILASASPSVSAAATPEGVGSRYSSRRWTVREGLPQSTVNGIHQTADGRLWLATFGGLAIFDGIRFEVLDQASNPELPSIRFTAITGADGPLWVSLQEHGIARYEHGRFLPLIMPPGLEHTSTGQLMRGPDGHVWGSHVDGLLRIDGDRVELISEPTEALGPIAAIQIDSRGALWARSERGAVCWLGACDDPGVLQPASHQPTGAIGWSRDPAGPGCGPGWSAPEGPAHGDDWYGLVRWGGATWCGTSAAAQSDADLAAKTLPTLRSALVDAEGSLWVGTLGSGLILIRDRGLTAYTGLNDAGLSSVWGMGEDKSGRIWVNQRRGFVTWLVDGVARPAPGEIRGLNPATLFVDGDGIPWLFSGQGAFRWIDEQLVRTPLGPIVPELVEAMLIEPDHAWFAAGSLYLMQGGQVTARWPEAEVGRQIQVIRRGPDGAIWVGGEQGLARVDTDGKVRRIGPADGLSSGVVRDLWWDAEGGLWVGTYGGGLSRVLGDRVQRVGPEGGLCESVVSRILVDERNNLWMNGNRGVSRVSLAELQGWLAGGQPVHCDLFDAGEGNWNSGFRARDGAFWFPTILGVTRIDPVAIDVQSSPKARILSVQVDDVSLPDARRAPPGNGQVTIQYTGVGLADAEAIRYRYRLAGYDKSWIDDHTSRTARYTSLPPGAYRFELQSRYASGAWSPTASTELVLTPHVYQTRAFQVGVVLFAATLGWAVAAGRARAAEAQNRALTVEIAERHRVEAALRERETHYRTVFCQASDGLFVHEADGRLIEVNPAGQALIGRSDDGEPLGYVSEASRERVFAAVTAASQGVTSTHVEAELRGDAGPVEVVLGVAPLGSGDAPRAIISAIDLRPGRRAERERRELEQQLQHSQRLEALGQFAAGIAHDFNNVLTVIGLHATLLAERADPESDSELGAIASAVQRAQALTRKLLAFGRAQPPSTVTAPLHETLEGAITMLRRVLPASVRLTVTHKDAPLFVEADPIRLEQVVMNLVINARDAIGRTGTIRLETALRRLGDADARRHSAEAGDYAILEVSDDGAGIQSDLKERIFDPFFSTKEIGKGTGLGLSTVKRAVRESGGFVTVDSDVGAGATFRVWLPLARANAEV